MMQQGTSLEIQQYVRIALYPIWGALAYAGVAVSTDRKALVISIVGFMATVAWTIYGSRLTALLDRAKATPGVEAIDVHVNPELIEPEQMTKATAHGIVAKPVGEIP